MNLYKYGWNWSQFVGTKECLESNLRDLGKLDFVLNLFSGRTSVVQAGGNLGIFPKRLAQEFETVYTFEPDPYNFRLMCQNAQEDNIIKFQAALHDVPDMISTTQGSVTHKHEGATHISGSGNTPSLKLDSFAISKCDLIYLDIEGHELYAIRGAFHTIMHSRPVVVAEKNVVAYRLGISEHSVDCRLRSMGYVKIFVLYTDYVYVHNSLVNRELYLTLLPELKGINGAYYVP